MMYQKPPALSWPIWKYVLFVFFLQILFTFMIWLDQSLVNNAPLSAIDIIVGSGIPLFALWQRWAWKEPNKVRLRSLIWAGNVFINLYLSGLLLAGATSKWSFFVGKPWSWIVNGSLLITFVGMWLLPLFSLASAEKLHKFQWRISGLALGLACIAGVLGASFGIFASRNGWKEEVLLVLGILLSLLAIGFAQHAGYVTWYYRPWVKEEE